VTDRTDRAALAGIVFLSLLAQVLLYPGIDTLVTALGATGRLSAGMWFLAAEFGASVVFVVVWGVVSDAVGRRAPLVVLGAVGGALGYATLALLPSLGAPFEVALLVRLLQGATTIGAFSLAVTMLMDLDGGHGRNMGAAGIAIGGGTALGAPLGGQLYEVGTLVPLVVASGLFVVAAVLATRVRDRVPGGAADTAPASTGGASPAATDAESPAAPGGFGRGTARAVVADVSRRPVLLVPYAFGFVDRLTAGFFALVGTFYFREVFELSPGATGLLLACFFAPFALFQYPFGALSDRVGRIGPVLVGSSVYGVAVVGVGLAPTVPLAAVAMLAVGVVGALMAPATMALVTDLAAPEGRATAMAGFNVFGSLGFLAGVLVGGGVASEFGYLAAFLVAGGVELLVVTATLPALPRLVGRVRTGAVAEG
jgi:MFS family permease